MTFLLRHLSKSYIHTSTAAKILSRCSLNSSISTHVNRGPPTFQVLRSFVTVKESVAGFDEMVCGSQRKYYMVGGKGGVGKTSCAASLAVKFASQGQHTIVVSTDPAHSLSDAFDQNLSGGMLVPVRGVDSTLYALEINTEKAREDYRTEVTQHGDAVAKSYLDMMGLGKLADHFGDFKLEELMDSQPPGLDEAITIGKVMQILEWQELSKFKRIVFDSPPTGYALRLLAFPDISHAYIGKMIELKKEIQSPVSELKSALENEGSELDAELKKEISSLVSELKSALGEEEAQPADARLSKEITSLFGEEAAPQHFAPDKLEQFRERMAKVRDLFHDPKSMEFVIVTIPTVMAVNESLRLCASLREDEIPVKRLIVNQVMPPSASDCKFCAMRRKARIDQMRALALIEKDPELAKLRLIQSPLMDVEIRGVPALKYMADMLWR